MKLYDVSIATAIVIGMVVALYATWESRFNVDSNQARDLREIDLLREEVRTYYQRRPTHELYREDIYRGDEQ